MEQCCDSIETSDVITVTGLFCSVSAPYLWPDIKPPQLRDCHGSTLASLGVRTEKREVKLSKDFCGDCLWPSILHVMSSFGSKPGKKVFCSSEDA